MQTSFAHIQTNFRDVGSERRTLPKSQNVMLERGRGLSDVQKEKQRKRTFAKSRKIRLNNYLQKIALGGILGLTVLATYFFGNTYLKFDPLLAGAIAIVLSALAGGWVFSRGKNKATIQQFRHRAKRMFTPDLQTVLNSEYWFGSQPVQFLFDDDHFMIAGANQEYFGYIPLTRILSIEAWYDDDFIGEHETPAIWLTIEGTSDFWADSNILIPGHFFEDNNLDAQDAHSKYERFRDLLTEACPNLRIP